MAQADRLRMPCFPSPVFDLAGAVFGGKRAEASEFAIADIRTRVGTIRRSPRPADFDALVDKQCLRRQLARCVRGTDGPVLLTSRYQECSYAD